MIPVKIIGTGLSPEDLTLRHLRIIDGADILVGGKRHLAYFPEHPAEKHPIGGGVTGLAEQVAEWAETKNVVVLASGDPLFYGIGSVFTRVLGAANVVIYPNVTSVAGAFARLREPWQNAGVISLHGRKNDHPLADTIREWDTVAVFTDPVNNPAWLASLLLEQGLADYRICVLEEMGADNERVEWYELADAAMQQFADPNLVVLKKKAKDGDDGGGEPKALEIGLGLPETCYVHRDGLITKAEVRAVSLSKLRLKPAHVLWDLGAGSGSVSIEASGILTEGRVFAVERQIDRIGDIRENIRRFSADRVETVHAELPEGLETLPDPDRIFVGGGGKNLDVILNAACARLKPGGVVVVNTVLLSNVGTALSTLAALGLTTEIVQVQINTGHSMPWDMMLKAQNPVFIIRGERQGRDRSGNENERRQNSTKNEEYHGKKPHSVRGSRSGRSRTDHGKGNESP